MSINTYLYLAEAPGESQQEGYVGWIEIQSFGLSSNNPSNINYGTGHAKGNPTVSGISITKFVDKATPMLFKNHLSGTHMATAKIHVVEVVGGAAAKPYYTMELQEVFIESMSWSGGSNQDTKPHESLSINFGQIKTSYSQQSSTGTTQGAIDVTWDNRANKVS